MCERRAKARMRNKKVDDDGDESDGMIKRTRGMEHPTQHNPRRAAARWRSSSDSFFSGLHVFTQ